MVVMMAVLSVVHSVVLRVELLVEGKAVGTVVLKAGETAELSVVMMAVWWVVSRAVQWAAEMAEQMVVMMALETRSGTQTVAMRAAAKAVLSVAWRAVSVVDPITWKLETPNQIVYPLYCCMYQQQCHWSTMVD
jgi:hypothetical protein